MYCRAADGRAVEGYPARLSLPPSSLGGTGPAQQARPSSSPTTDEKSWTIVHARSPVVRCCVLARCCVARLATACWCSSSLHPSLSSWWCLEPRRRRCCRLLYLCRNAPNGNEHASCTYIDCVLALQVVRVSLAPVVGIFIVCNVRRHVIVTLANGETTTYAYYHARLPM